MAKVGEVMVKEEGVTETAEEEREVEAAVKEEVVVAMEEVEEKVGAVGG